MSVLLIGANSDTFTNGFRIRRKREVNRNRVKQLKQQEYKNSLEEQIRQNSIRKSREEYVQKWINMQIEEGFQRQIQIQQHKQLERLNHIRQEAPITSAEEDENSLSHEKDTEKKEKSYQLPAINTYQTTYLNAYQTPGKAERSKLVNLSTDYHRPVSKRTKTPAEHHYHKARRFKTQNFNENNSFIEPQWQNPQANLQKLKDFEDKKINEVYQMLLDSVKIFNTDTLDLNSFPKNNLELRPQYRRYRSSSLRSDEDINNDAYYTLPSKSRRIQLEGPLTTHKERQWRSWYAKQKLRELQSYIKKEHLDHQIEEKMFRLNKIHLTPRFTPEE